MLEKTEEEYLESANKYKLKCINYIIDNNITIAPLTMDPTIFKALRKLATEKSNI